jgi:hypothetical protein
LAVICAARLGLRAVGPGLSPRCVCWAGVLCAPDRQQRATATASGCRAGRSQATSLRVALGQRADQAGRPPGRLVVSGTSCPGSRMRSLAGRVPALLTAAGGVSPLAQARLLLLDSDGAGRAEPGRPDSDGDGGAGLDPGPARERCHVTLCLRSRTRSAANVPSVPGPRASRSLQPCTRCKPELLAVLCWPSPCCVAASSSFISALPIIHWYPGLVFQWISHFRYQIFPLFKNLRNGHSSRNIAQLAAAGGFGATSSRHR